MHYTTGYHHAFNIAMPSRKQRSTAKKVPLWYYQDLMCYTYVLATYYLYTIYMIPQKHPTHPTGMGGGKVDRRWIIYMLAT